MSEPTRIRVLIADDERLARQRLEDLLAHERNVDIVGSIDNGKEAVAAIRSLAPDIVFLDVQMPGMTGFEMVSEVGPQSMPATIFVTAFDQYALKAFDVAALDYLVKPFDDDRFAQAFSRARQSVELHEVGRMTRRLVTLLGEPAAAPQPVAAPRPQYLERIAVESRGQVRVVPAEKIEYITASGPYAELHVGDKTYTVRERMQNLEDRLDPAKFFRIHRSAIVRLDRIDAMLRSSGGDYAVRLKNGEELSVSRSRRDELEAKMGIG